MTKVGEDEDQVTSGTGNPHLSLWIAATGLSHGEIARRVATKAKAQGHRQVAPDATRVRRWMDGERPRPPVPALLAEVVYEAVGEPLTPGDLGLAATGPALDTIQLPLLTEAATEALAGWTQMDLFMNRRDTLKLAVGAPLILAAERMLRSRALVASQTGRVHAALGNECQAEGHLAQADELLADGLGDQVPKWVAYFDAAEHAGARAVSARDLTGLGRPGGRASTHFQDTLRLRKHGFERVRVMDRVGLAAALFDEGEPEQAANAADKALDDASRVDSTLVASRLNTLLDAARPYRTAAVDEVRTLAKDLAAARPTTVTA
ncbi:hypothetical protein [Streptantibioticus ferralitis]|uniref:hypothetical protein n=1 Tax=Streptantibioticus ferralitis TaxID=236510 RepID=UPI0023DA5EE0|nr:hypothetical protein [Streptantibioticus ferralitis]